jgi:hypothetical protein
MGVGDRGDVTEHGITRGGIDDGLVGRVPYGVDAAFRVVMIVGIGPAPGGQHRILRMVIRPVRSGEIGIGRQDAVQVEAGSYFQAVDGAVFSHIAQRPVEGGRELPLVGEDHVLAEPAEGVVHLEAEDIALGLVDRRIHEAGNQEARIDRSAEQVQAQVLDVRIVVVVEIAEGEAEGRSRLIAPEIGHAGFGDEIPEEEPHAAGGNVAATLHVVGLEPSDPEGAFPILPDVRVRGELGPRALQRVAIEVHQQSIGGMADAPHFRPALPADAVLGLPRG